MSGNKKNNSLGNKVREIADQQLGVNELVQQVENGDVVLVNQVDGTTEVLPVVPVEASDNKEVETKEPNGTTEEVKKIVVPNKVSSAAVQKEVIPQLLDYIFANHLNLVETITQTIKDAPSVKENMVKDALAKQEETTLAYTQLMSKGIVMPFTPEFEKLQQVMLELHHAKQAEETARNTDVATLAKASLDTLKATIVKDIETIMLATCGKETTNSGKPEGSPKNGKTLNWQHETTISYWRNSSFLQICPVAWLSVEYREEHELQANWYVAIDAKTGKIAHKVQSASTYSNLFFQITSQQLVEKGEELPETDTWGKNQTLIGSTTTDKQKIEYAGLTQEKLRELVGDKGDDFTVSISEEVGQDDSTALPVVTQTEQPESVSA